MALLTIGAFARAARLTRKALRLYDELGLLPPAAVDPDSGYRFYDRDQLAQARLVARLRRIGMPLAEIAVVCRAEPEAAAEAVRAFWQRTSADTAARARLVTSLVAHLSERGTTMSELGFDHAVHCAAGAVRTTNEDSAHAGERLLAVADGMRGPGGAAAARTAVDALKPLVLNDLPAAELLTQVAAAVTEVDRRVRASATPDHQPVTTLTALLRSGSQLALVHIGDSRAYLLRHGELHQLTQDHTHVRTLVEAGTLTPAEAAAHPERALLTRALGAGGPHVEADLALRTALPGDRYLLCSDGVSAVLDRPALHTALSEAAGPAAAVDRLVELVHGRGAPDNLACVVADVRWPGAHGGGQGTHIPFPVPALPGDRER
ncbi:serine/threonine protein phosphatase PrpC [Crossiella equi]|uniref:Serine/threonine protein phosphatase PrpC n=1 Tax=Crossiella equi TaxID=130796 RepID=A0ABS5ABN8_9PSEU|nr:MerR family transcriptional regulator [Crossiella equi]MBP2473985.1 serine/threonine protein phosphatase PrpC [Crossiella equi]